jgi:molybdate transport system substrate-binding protein
MTMRYIDVGRVITAIIALALLPAGGAALGAEIKLLASTGVRAALVELLPQFEARTGHKVNADFAVIVVLKRRIDAGEDFDVVIPSPAVVDELIREGKVRTETRVPFARTGLALAVAKGMPRPDISNVENFKRALLEAKSVAYAKEGASGKNFLEILDRLGIAAEMESKIKPTSGGNAIQNGEADMAISGMGPTMEMPGSQYLGGIPPQLQRYVTFAAGVSAQTKYIEAAMALLRFLTSPAAAAVFEAKGLEQGVN